MLVPNSSGWWWAKEKKDDGRLLDPEVVYVNSYGDGNTDDMSVFSTGSDCSLPIDSFEWLEPVQSVGILEKLSDNSCGCLYYKNGDYVQ